MGDSKLIAPREDVSAVSPQHTLSAKHHDLRRQFASVRKVRGDGNCFYRGFCFAHLESLLNNGRALERFKDKIKQSANDILRAGFEEEALKTHLNTFLDVLQKCQAAEEEATLLQLFNEQRTSDSVVQYLRLLTSAHLQNHADFFRNFVESPNLKLYCHREVEAMSMECDHVDILALTQALDVAIHISSMEGNEQNLVHYVIPEGLEPSLHLLYQTAHYDILYPHPEPKTATSTQPPEQQPPP